ncbi:MAG TPA: hypothetical protein VGD99_07715 [Anaerolineae bacterium]
MSRKPGSSIQFVRGEPTALDPESDGRVYHVFFTATDEDGGTCTVDSSSEVKLRIGVVAEDDEGDDIDLDEIDQGPLYDSSQNN